MSHETDVQALLQADGTFTGSITSARVFSWVDTGRSGISPSGTPAAYSSGILQPSCIVKERSQTPSGAIKDQASGTTSYRGVVELWFYDDADSDGSTLETARARAVALINEAYLSNGGLARWIGHVIMNARDDSLQGAVMMRSDFEVLNVLN